MSVYLIATLDTKGLEARFLSETLQALGVEVQVIDSGCLGVPGMPADIPRETVFEAAQTTLQEMISKGDRGDAVSRAATGAACIISNLHAAGRVDGVISLGGSAGSTIGSAAMRVLPVGIPKILISTLASGQVRHYVQDKDIFMLNSIVDIAGINRISRAVLSEAARAMAGMVLFATKGRGAVSGESAAADRPLIAATMFGVTTPCVTHARKILEAAGYEVLVFHATGTGGRAMESLIADGLIAGVLDMTTTELADELVGGVLSAGPDRLTAAAIHGVPQVISVGALDMVNFGPRETVPARFQSRQFYLHNANVTLMRTTPDENRQLGEEVGRKAAASSGSVAILLPLRGVSAIDSEGHPFDNPVARQALFEGIRASRRNVELIEIDAHINDTLFAETAAKRLLAMVENRALEQK